jgi:hypothetical protein
VGGQRHAPAALTPGKTRYPLYSRLGGPQVRSGRVRKNSPLPGFDLRIVQPVASRYTDWAIPAPINRYYWDKSPQWPFQDTNIAVNMLITWFFFGNPLLKSWIGDGLTWQEICGLPTHSPSQMQQYYVKLRQDTLLPQHFKYSIYLSHHYTLQS